MSVGRKTIWVCNRHEVNSNSASHPSEVLSTNLLGRD